MDTSVKKLISMDPLEDYFIYYDLKNQVFYGIKQGMNYSAIAAPIAIYSLQWLSNCSTKPLEMSHPLSI